MSSDGAITIRWGDDEHRFRLAIGQLRELQTKCNAGPLEILDRIVGRTWRVDDLRETLRLGLIGGGMAPIEALALIAIYVDDRPLLESAPPAQAVLAAAMVGLPEDRVGKEPGGEMETPGSSSPPSTESGPFSGGPPGRLMN